MEVMVFKDDQVIGWNITIARTFFRRLVGLWGKKKLEKGEGLLLMPCRQIHTWFMSMPIDVIFLDKGGQIVEIIADMSPGKVSPLVKEGQCVLELPAGTSELFLLEKGEQLVILEI